MMTGTAKRSLSLATQMRLFLSGPLNQWSWFLLGLGLIGLWVVISSVDVSFFRYWGAVEHVQGVVTDSRETNLSVNETPVFANSYRFTSRDGVEFEDFSYATGRWHPDGTTVTVEYPVGNPHLSRIKGMRRQLFGPLGLLFALPFVAAVILLTFRIRKGLQCNHLLQYGHLTTATLLDKEATNTSINEKPVYKLTFAFFAHDGVRYQVTYKTHLTSRLEDEEAERLLYNPESPANAVLVDTLPGMPDLDDDGVVRPQSIPVASCIIPALALVGHGAYALFRFYS